MMKILNNLAQQEILNVRKVEDLYTYSYTHGGVDFNNEYTRIARGLTLDEDGNVILIGFEKFFNLNQLEQYEIYDEDFKNQHARLFDNEIYECYEKLDGSLILAGSYKGELVVATTKAVNTEIALLAKEYLIKRLGNRLNEFLNTNACYVFEYIGKSNRIGVKYDVYEDLILLRVNDLKTLKPLKDYDNFGFEEPKIFYMTLDELVEMQENAENREGVVVKNQYGNLIKVKTKWWFKNKISDIIFSRKITKRYLNLILEHYLNDTVDDLMGYLYDYGKQVDVVKAILNKIDFYNEQVKLLKAKDLRELYTYKSRYLGLAASKMLNSDTRKAYTKLLREDFIK